ncbi:MAG: type II toxin-antitoxin system VapC family toxin [Thaumarchaeota archaeon]|nr:type II toxin-antitoxin system VapC family toxin [Nitrososphaerota archaeon]
MSIESNPNPLEENVVSQIIDSSALTKYVAKERDWAKIEKYLASADSLELALIETGNALWKKTLKKEIDLETTKKIVQILSGSIWFLDQQKYVARALEIAVKYRITVYDSLFVACAEMENSDLISCDGRQIEVAEELGIKTISV